MQLGSAGKGKNFCGCLFCHGHKGTLRITHHQSWNDGRIDYKLCNALNTIQDTPKATYQISCVHDHHVLVDYLANGA